MRESGLVGKVKQKIASQIGYAHVHLIKDGESCMRHVHRLVAEAFIGPCPEGLQTRHMDGNPENNNVENLRWGSAAENAKDKERHGTQLHGESQPNAKLDELKIADIVKMIRNGLTHSEVSLKSGICRSQISSIARGDAWRRATGGPIENIDAEEKKRRVHAAAVAGWEKRRSRGHLHWRLERKKQAARKDELEIRLEAMGK